MSRAALYMCITIRARALFHASSIMSRPVVALKKFQMK